MSVNKILVTMQLDGKDVPCGVITQTLRGGHETIGFTYDSNYPSVSGAIPLSPDNPFGLGPWFSSGMRELRAISDAMPDRWGRNLMAREEARRARLANSTPRTLFDLDYLLGVDDVQRQGALRFWADGVPQTSNNAGVPREVDLPNLLNTSDAASQDMNIDVRDLLQAGSSLGGARPKASVRDERGILHIAKFPKNSESAYEDVCAWEKVSLDIASAAGLTVPFAELDLAANRLSALKALSDCRQLPIDGEFILQHTNEQPEVIESPEYLKEIALHLADDASSWMRFEVNEVFDTTLVDSFLKSASHEGLSELESVSQTASESGTRGAKTAKIEQDQER